MWVLLSSRLRTWLVLAVAIPVVRALLRRTRKAAENLDPDGLLTATLARTDSALARLDRRRSSRDGPDGRAHRGGRTRDGSYRTHGAKGGWL